MTDADFQRREKMGLEQVPQEIPSHMKREQLDALTAIVGSDNVRTDAYSRLQVAYGKTMVGLMRLREGIVENVADVVLHPRSTADIESIIRYCNDQRIAVYVYSGGSSVTRGVEAVRGGVTLDMRVHMDKVVRFSEKNLLPLKNNRRPFFLEEGASAFWMFQEPKLNIGSGSLPTV